jgi:transcriptional regulator with XRE-family HTH domain
MELNSRKRSALALAVAAQIRAERAAAGMTQQEVQDASGIPKSTHLRLESGERVADVSQLAAFCAAVNVPVAVFMARAEARLETVATPAPPLVEDDDITRELMGGMSTRNQRKAQAIREAHAKANPPPAKRKRKPKGT